MANTLPKLKYGDYAINLNSREPLYGPFYNLSQTKLAELRRYLKDILARGWIRRSISFTKVPILFIPKKDGGLRLYIDYKGLNTVIIKNRYPLPLIIKTLNRLNGFKRFFKLNLKDTYYRLRIKSGDKQKTAFYTRYGYFEY